MNYRFGYRGSGICGSDSNLEVSGFMNKVFRPALLRNLKDTSSWKVIDFTRYDLKAKEPNDPKPGQHVRNGSLMNRLNQKGIRHQDKPVDIRKMTSEGQSKN